MWRFWRSIRWRSLVKRSRFEDFGALKSRETTPTGGSSTAWFSSSPPPYDPPNRGALDTRREEALPGPEPTYSTVHKGYELFHHRAQFATSFGELLPELVVAYETWGELNSAKDNVILLMCGLSASSHAKSSDSNPSPGWWENFIGPALALDTNHFHVICTNNLGGCYGTSGPSSINPETGERYALTFPMFTVQDMVNAMVLLLDNLGIDRLHGVVGSSLGGMQSLCFAAMYPERVGRMVSISAAALSHPMSIAVRYAQRQILMADPNFRGGNYYDSEFPSVGMRLAREVATVTYRSGPEWQMRFARHRIIDSPQPSLGPEFSIESYLHYQGMKWCSNYDPNSMLLISKAMDLFSMEKKNASGELDLREGLRPVKMPCLIMGVQSDILFPVWQQQQVARILREVGNSCVCYYELDSIYGHDTFLLDITNVGAAVKGHLEQRKAWCS